MLPTPPHLAPRRVREPHSQLAAKRSLVLGGRLGTLWIKAALASGPQNRLFRVEGPHLRGPAVLKVTSNATQGAFEHALWRRVISPNVLKVGALVRRQGSSYFLIEDGAWGALDELLLQSRQQGRPFALGERLSWWRHAVTAVAACHQQGIIHGDVALKNIMAVPTSQGHLVAKLGDFGLAAVGPTAHGQGSIETLAPEALFGLPVGPAADVWSLGCCLYALVMGIEPFYDDDVGLAHRKLMTQHRSVLPEEFVYALRLEGLGDEQSARLGALCERLLLKAPSQRPSCAAILTSFNAIVPQ